MKFPILIVALLGLALGGCQSGSTDPYKLVNTGVVDWDGGVKVANTAAPFTPKEDVAYASAATDTYIATIPAQISLANLTGTPSAPDAITLPVLQANIQTLEQDAATLRSFVVSAIKKIATDAVKTHAAEPKP